MRQDISLTNFTAGEISPRVRGRIDLAKWFNGAETVLNFVPMPQGGLVRRPGTMFVAQAGDQSHPVRLVSFIFNTVQAYVLEFGAGYVRVFMNDGAVLSGGAPVSVSVPYGVADLPQLKFTQSYDRLYITHRAYPPATLSRSSHTSWSYAALGFKDGPYLAINTTDTTLTPSGATGSITITASAVAGINVTPQNPGQGFLASDVGRLLRIKVSSKWGWCKITAVASTTSITATVQDAVNNGAQASLDGTGATKSWRLGKWGAGPGYPYAVTFWQQRQMFGGTDNEPSSVEGSVTSDFTNFAPSTADNTVTDTHALSWVIGDDQANAIHWLSPAGSAQAMQLGIGTQGSEHIMQAATTAQALTPTSVQVYRETVVGSAADVAPLRIGKSTLFPSHNGRKLYEWNFSWQENGYLTPDRAEFAEHITRSGLVQIAYQQQPFSVVWGITADCRLVGMTYVRSEEVVGWHRHQLGGQYYGAAPRVESMAIIPSPDGGYDELWLSVLRTIGGAPVRTIEVMTRYFEAQPTEQAWFVDCALTGDLTRPAATLTIGATDGTGISVTASAAVFSAGSVGAQVRVNGGLAVVGGTVDSSHVLCDWLRPAESTAPALSGAWSCTAPHASFAGLDHLNGEMVAMLGDGADFGTATVGAGAVTLPDTAAAVTIGLPFETLLVSQPFEPQRAAAAVAQGKPKRLDTIYLRLFESLGCEYGTRIRDTMTGAIEEWMEALETRSAADRLGQPPALFTGIERLKMKGGYGLEGQILIRTRSPLPLTVLAIAAKADIGEMPQ